MRLTGYAVSAKSPAALDEIGMPRKIRQLKSGLRQAGFLLVPGRGKGSPTVWIHPVSRTSVTVSGSDSDDAHFYQERDIREAIAEVIRVSHREGQ